MKEKQQRDADRIAELEQNAGGPEDRPEMVDENMSPIKIPESEAETKEEKPAVEDANVQTEIAMDYFDKVESEMSGSPMSKSKSR